MKIGVIDTDASFRHDYFTDKRINIVRFNEGYTIVSDEQPLSHAEFVCATILHENSQCEIILHSIVGQTAKNTGALLLKSIYQMIENGVILINISLGIEKIAFEEIQQICEIATQNQVFIIAAHSNNGVVTYPAVFNNVLGVKKDSGNNKQFIHYDKMSNNIIFHNYNYVSCMHLNQEHLLKGNSFITAKITGILSNYFIHKSLGIGDIISMIENSIVNKIPNFDNYINLNVICFSNRFKNYMQIKYAKECLDCECIINLETFNFNEIKQYCNYDVCVIDINDYNFFTRYKQLIIDILFEKIFEHLFMRYPFFNFYERLKIFKSTGILIEQLYL